MSKEAKWLSPDTNCPPNKNNRITSAAIMERSNELCALDPGGRTSTHLFNYVCLRWLQMKRYQQQCCYKTPSREHGTDYLGCEVFLPSCRNNRGNTICCLQWSLQWVTVASSGGVKKSRYKTRSTIITIPDIPCNYEFDVLPRSIIINSMIKSLVFSRKQKLEFGLVLKKIHGDSWPMWQKSVLIAGGGQTWWLSDSSRVRLTKVHILYQRCWIYNSSEGEFVLNSSPFKFHKYKRSTKCCLSLKGGGVLCFNVRHEGEKLNPAVSVCRHFYVSSLWTRTGSQQLCLTWGGL